VSNNPSDNNEIKAAGKAKSRGPSLRIETAGDIPEEKLTRVAAKFAEVNEIEDYRLSIELREDLIGGFIIYFQGSRYDYSVKGQLARIGSFIKRTRSIDGYEDGIAAQRKALTEDFPATKVKKDLETALEQFPESNMLSIDNVEIFELTDEELDKRVENAFVSEAPVSGAGKTMFPSANSPPHSIATFCASSFSQAR